MIASICSLVRIDAEVRHAARGDAADAVALVLLDAVGDPVELLLEAGRRRSSAGSPGNCSSTAPSRSDGPKRPAARRSGLRHERLGRVVVGPALRVAARAVDVEEELALARVARSGPRTPGTARSRSCAPSIWIVAASRALGVSAFGEVLAPRSARCILGALDRALRLLLQRGDVLAHLRPRLLRRDLDALEVVDEVADRPARSSGRRPRRPTPASACPAARR